MSFDGEPTASEYQPSSEEVLAQTSTEREALSVDLLSQYPTITARVTELATKFPDFKPNLNEQEIWREAVSVMVVYEEDSQLFEQEYSL